MTLPRVSVATVRFWFVLEAMKVYRPAIEVVATTPLMLVVITPAFAETAFELMISAVVVDITPFTLEVQAKLLVEVATVKVLVVLEASRSEAVIWRTLPDPSFTKSVFVAVPEAMVPRFALPVTFRFVVVALVDVRLVIDPVFAVIEFRTTSSVKL